MGNSVPYRMRADWFLRYRRLVLSTHYRKARDRASNGHESIHHRSLRAGQFVVFNCDLVDHLFTSSDLFTVQEGWQIFFIPTNNHHSRYQSADGGTLFLSEIDKLSLSNQSILLNYLNQQDQTIKTKTAIMLTLHRN